MSGSAETFTDYERSIYPGLVDHWTIYYSLPEGPARLGSVGKWQSIILSSFGEMGVDGNRGLKISELARQEALVFGGDTPRLEEE